MPSVIRAASRPSSNVEQENSPVKGTRQPRPSEVRAVAKKRADYAAAECEAAAWEDFANEAPELPSLLDEYRKCADQIKTLEARKKEIAPEIEAAVIIGGKKALTCGSFRVTRVEVAGRKSIAPERVVEKAAAAGMDAEQITDMLQYATGPAPGHSYPLVSRIEE